jgi:hypothetical protein
MALLNPASSLPAAGAAGRTLQPEPFRRRLAAAAAAAALLFLAACESGGGADGDPASASESTSADTADAAATAGESTASESTASESTASESTVAVTPDESAAGPPGSGIATGRPFVVIRFPDGGTEYETELSAAVRLAQERKPGFAVDMAAVAPSAGSPKALKDSIDATLGRADAVIQSLSSMGVGRDRIHLVSYSSPDADVTEIRLYIR